MSERIPVRVVVVTMYETALETNDHFGEFRLWVERLPLAPFLKSRKLSCR